MLNKITIPLFFFVVLFIPNVIEAQTFTCGETSRTSTLGTSQVEIICNSDHLFISYKEDNTSAQHLILQDAFQNADFSQINEPYIAFMRYIYDDYSQCSDTPSVTSTLFNIRSGTSNIQVSPQIARLQALSTSTPSDFIHLLGNYVPSIGFTTPSSLQMRLRPRDCPDSSAGFRIYELWINEVQIVGMSNTSFTDFLPFALQSEQNQNNEIYIEPVDLSFIEFILLMVFLLFLGVIVALTVRYIL